MRLTIKWVGGWAHVHGTGPDGQRIRRALKTQDAKRAEEARAHLEGRLWKASHYGPEAVVTFAEAAVAYAENNGELRFLDRMVVQLGDKLLREITPRAIAEAARRAYPAAAPATVNRQGITPARAVMNYGHSQGWCAPIRVDGLPVPPAKKVAVDQGYLDALKPHIPHRAYALLTFLHYTGRRVGDAIALTPDRLAGDRAFFPTTKNGEAAVAVMPPQVAKLVSGLEPRHGRVFGYVNRSSLYSTLRRACKKAGLPYIGTHQIGRHSFATALHGAGLDAKMIADAGGWKSPALVQKTYVHTTNAQQIAAGIFGKKMAKSAKAKRQASVKE